MPTDDEAIRAQAVEWHLRRRDMAVADWPAFISWLEADSAHTLAYDALTMEEAATAPVVVANDIDMPRARGGYRWAALAASVAVVATAGAMLLQPPATPADQSFVVSTPAGGQRTVILADGSRIELGGNTRLMLDHGDPRYVALERGAAVFHVTHNAARPFRLQTDGYVLEDIGTVFEVARTDTRLDVTVAEGGVLFEPDGRAMTVTPGKHLSVNSTSNAVALETLPAGRIGEWRDGRLAFTDEPLAYAVERLSRVTGAGVSLAPTLHGRRFTGMVRLTGSAAHDIPHFAELTGTSWTQVGDNWVIGPQRGR